MSTPVDDVVTHHDVDVDAVRLHYVAAGPPDGRLVVLLHGFPEFWYSWRHQLPALAEAGYRAVAPDLRGYNRSDKPRDVDAYALPRITRDVEGLIHALGRERAVVVGHDWGGAVAWLTAMTRGDVVEQLVVANAPHPVRFAAALRSPAQIARSSYMALFNVPVLPELVLRAGRFAPLRWGLRVLSVRPDAFTDADLNRYVEALSEPGSLRGALSYYRAMGRQLVRGRAGGGGGSGVRTITAPTLVIWGTGDLVLPPHLADPGDDLVPDCRVEYVEPAGHFVQADAPERFNELLLDFLSA